MKGEIIDTIKAKIGIILTSSTAFDFYREATGKTPERVPDGKSTLLTSFECRDDSGTVRAALLVNQQGFSATAEETAKGEEVNGLMVVVAEDVPVEDGHSVLREWAGRMMRDER